MLNEEFYGAKRCIKKWKNFVQSLNQILIYYDNFNLTKKN